MDRSLGECGLKLLSSIGVVTGYITQYKYFQEASGNVPVGGLSGDRHIKVVGGSAYRLARHHVTDLGEEVEMAVRMPGLTHGGRPEHGGDVVVTFDVSLLREVDVAHVRFGVIARCPVAAAL